MIEQMQTLEAIIRDSFLKQPLLSLVALTVTAFLLVLEYYIVTTTRRGHLDKEFLVSSKHWLSEARHRHFGETFTPRASGSDATDERPIRTLT